MIGKVKMIPDGKASLKKLAIQHYKDADYMYYPITSQRCPQGETCVIGGQFVKVGEVIGTRKASFFEQPIHATVSGEVMGSEQHIDQSGKKVNCLIIKNDKKYTVHESVKARSDAEIEALTQKDYVKIVKDAGLVGLGGGAFPSYIKLMTKDPIDVVVANGVECEPYLIADYGLMMNKPRRVIEGMIYAMKAVSAKRGVIAIKKKYKEIKERLEFTLKEYSDYPITVKEVKNHYPQGWELDTIKEAVGIKIPQKKLLSKYGVLNFNVSTLASIYSAVKEGLPVLERLFTISGDGICNQSFRARIGTNVKDLIALTGGYKQPEVPKTMILGGPMMGVNVTSDDIVMTHTTTSLIVSNTKTTIEEPCVHCASCVYSCPAGLQPVQIMNAYKTKDKAALKKLEVDYCIDCGLCSYVCPSKIHLTDYMRKAKTFANKK